MNDFKKQKCIELTNKMLRMDLCRPFKDKVDPIRDGAPDYLTIVQRPMDLTTIRKKLNNNEYKSYENWAEDVNQVWENAMIYNNEGTLIYVMAQDMELWFRKKYQNLPQDRDEEWMKTLRKASKRCSSFHAIRLLLLHQQEHPFSPMLISFPLYLLFQLQNPQKNVLRMIQNKL